MKTRPRIILALALPIVGAMASQNVMGLVDTAMVGALGTEALAAVGLGTFVTFVAQALLLGLESGVQALVSRAHGAKDDAAITATLRRGLGWALVGGVPLTAVLFFVAPIVVPHLNDDAAVVSLSVGYTSARAWGMVPIGMMCAFRGYFNGIGQPRQVLSALLFSHAINIAVSAALVFGLCGLPELGVTGAGIGTNVASWCGTLYFAVAVPWRQTASTSPRRRGAFGGLLAQSLPSGARQLFVALGLTALIGMIGCVSTNALAAANVVINFTLVAMLPGLGLGQAAATLVGQALGRGDVAGARRWGWDVSLVGIVVLGAIGLPLFVAPDTLAGLMVADPETIALARFPLRLTGATIWLDGCGLVLVQALLGAGDSRRVMMVGVLQQFCLLPAAFVAGLHLGLGLAGIWSAFVALRVVQAVVAGAMWRGGRWAQPLASDEAPAPHSAPLFAA